MGSYLILDVDPIEAKYLIIEELGIRAKASFAVLKLDKDVNFLYELFMSNISDLFNGIFFKLQRRKNDFR